MTVIVLATVELATCGADAPSATSHGGVRAGVAEVSRPPVLILASDFSPEPLSPGDALAAAALARTAVSVVYDPAYRSIDFPMGDVAPDRGVCTDVVIRSYRALGVDLQALVNADMRADFNAYPSIWGLSRPDPNIDHRRVPNLEAFFTRHGAALPVSQMESAVQPGDLVTYRLGGRLPHIAIVSDRVGPSGALMIVHNIGAGPVLEDALYDWSIEAWFRWAPDAS